MNKQKLTKTQPTANGHHAAKPTKEQSKSNGRHELKAAQTQPKSDGIADRPATRLAKKGSAQHHERKLEKFHGVLQDFNLGPNGGIEGFLLHSDGQTVQVNVTPDVGFAVVRGIGQHVEATVEAVTETAKHSKGDHSVYNLVTLTATDGKTLIFSGTEDPEMTTVQGVIKRINYAPNGAANGVILESGDFIYLKAEGMKRIDLKVGDQVRAEGTAALMPLGQRVIEAETVNGTSVTSKKRVHATSQRGS